MTGRIGRCLAVNVIGSGRWPAVVGGRDRGGQVDEADLDVVGSESTGAGVRRPGRAAGFGF